MPLLNDADAVHVGGAAAARVYLGSTEVWAPAPSGPKLARWSARAALSATQQLNWMAIGDSVTEGALASSLGTRYVTRTAAALQTTMTPGGVGGVGFVNAFSNGGTHGSDLWSHGSGGGDNANGFLGYRQYGFNPGATSTLTFTGTSFTLHTAKGHPNVGQYTVTIDGGAPTTVTPVQDGNYNQRGTWTSPTLTAGTHSVVLAPVSGSGGGQIWVRGVQINNGDENKGLHVWESGHYGYQASHWSSAATSLADGLAVVQPALLTIFLGLNDYQNGVAPATYQSTLQTLATTWRGLCTVAPSVVYVAPYARSDVPSPAYPIAQYAAACAAAAAAIGDADVLDLSQVITPANRAGLLNVDGVHPNDSGHQAIADALSAKLLALA